MASIKATDLATLLPEDIDSSYNVVVFDPSGNTNQVAFQAATHQANTNNGCICVKEASLTIPSADVLQLNSTPLTIVPAQGVGTAIEVISASVKMVYNSVAYATNTTLELKITGSNSPQIQWSALVLSATADKFNTRPIDDNSNTNLVENSPLVVTVDTGDPTAGDSDITVYVTYRVITL